MCYGLKYLLKAYIFGVIISAAGLHIYIVAHFVIKYW